MRTRHFSSSDSVPSSLRRSSTERKRAAAFAKASAGQGHRPVLLHEVVEALDIQKDDIVVDTTLGGAGHARELVKGLGGNGLFIGFDADADAIEKAREALMRARSSVRLVHANFRRFVSELAALRVRNVSKVLFDLGWSSYQLDSGRGFSFNTDEPLLMTYSNDARDALTAVTVVNEWGEHSIADIIFGFGGERYARRIAKAIVEYRKEKRIETSRELARIIRAAMPRGYTRRRIDPSTRTFQALRIAVNDELAALSEGLAGAWRILESGGRIAVISFHSLEDGIVKRTFAQWERAGEGKRVMKKPIRPGAREVAENPRSRSAKLRVFEKISHENPRSKNQQVRTLDLPGEA